MTRILSFGIFLFGATVRGFVVPAQQTFHALLSSSSSSVLGAKGFGAKETPPAPKKKAPAPAPQTIRDEPAPSVISPTLSNPFPDEEVQDLSQGKAALEKMRRVRAEQRNDELRKVKEVQDVDELLRESPEAAVIPERVAQRMGKRMLPFVGIPLFGAMGSFVTFWYMATYRDTEFQPALVAATSIALLAFGLVGITYSIMSASWDPDREGSALGTDEFSKNLDNIKTGLSRSRENARLRELEVSPSEMSNLEKKDAVKGKRTQSFSDRLGDDLD